MIEYRKGKNGKKNNLNPRIFLITRNDVFAKRALFFRPSLNSSAHWRVPENVFFHSRVRVEGRIAGNGARSTMNSFPGDFFLVIVPAAPLRYEKRCAFSEFIAERRRATPTVSTPLS